MAIINCKYDTKEKKLLKRIKCKGFFLKKTEEFISLLMTIISEGSSMLLQVQRCSKSVTVLWTQPCLPSDYKALMSDFGKSNLPFEDLGKTKKEKAIKQVYSL